jgi:FtsH-binding integral membrane protein
MESLINLIIPVGSLFGAIGLFITGAIISNKKSNKRSAISAILMTASIVCMAFTLKSIIGDNNDLTVLISMGTLTWGVICLHTALINKETSEVKNHENHS